MQVAAERLRVQPWLTTFLVREVVLLKPSKAAKQKDRSHLAQGDPSNMPSSLGLILLLVIDESSSHCPVGLPILWLIQSLPSISHSLHSNPLPLPSSFPLIFFLTLFVCASPYIICLALSFLCFLLTLPSHISPSSFPSSYAVTLHSYQSCQFLPPFILPSSLPCPPPFLLSSHLGNCWCVSSLLDSQQVAS